MTSGKNSKEKTGELRKHNQNRRKRLGWKNPNEQKAGLPQVMAERAKH